MIPDIVRVQLLLCGIDFCVSVDDDIPGFFFLQDLSIHVPHQFAFLNDHVPLALPGMGFCVLQTGHILQDIQISAFSAVKDFQLIGEPFKIVLLFIFPQAHGHKVFIPAPAADQRVAPVFGKIGNPFSARMRFGVRPDDPQAFQNCTVIKHKPSLERAEAQCRDLSALRLYAFACLWVYLIRSAPRATFLPVALSKSTAVLLKSKRTRLSMG